MILSKDEILNLTRLPKNFDSNLIDLDYGFQSKIFPLVSQNIFDELKTEKLSIYQNLAKAGVLYAFVLDIPKIKVHISNYGINQFEQNKTAKAPWWDVRDLGLSWLKKADFFLATALKQLGTEANYKTTVDFFNKSFPLISFEEFDTYYGLNNSIDSYFTLVQLMNSIWEDFQRNFAPCSVDDFLADETLKQYIRGYIINRALSDAADYGSLVFLTTGIAYQYEELPWQKSVVLSVRALNSIRAKYRNEADYFLKRIFVYLQNNQVLFPCYAQRENNGAKIIKKKGGLFL
ncbi:hypothetical protein AB4865_07470 [Capnocytophaga sp. ARDL2]|uniref:DUF6712 family protein n=1 Tax=Capnocytophaga sp. ARDL2 TaxID=3238809 RepID=UPI0035592A05